MSPEVQLVVADSESPKQFTLQEALKSVSWETTLLDQPGKLTFEIIDTFSETFFEGSNIVLAVDGVKVFDGYVFSRKRTHNDIMTITAYDRLRYLQNQDTYVFEKATASEIFAKICKEQQIPYTITSKSNYKTSPVAHDNKSLHSIIKRALDETIIKTGQYLTVRDNVGKLDLVDISTLTTNILVSDESLLTGFAFESSIDTSTYNYIKLVQDNKKTHKRDVYIAKDSATIGKWGRLQHTEKVDESATASQIREKVNQLLKLYNRKTRSLSVSCIGNTSVQVGSGVCVSIPKLASEGIAQMQYMFVSKVSHKIANESYTMDLTLEVV